MDTRERVPWYIESCDNITGHVRKKLNAGDYSIAGLENKVCIERKRTVGEFAGNIVTKRFERALARIAEVPIRYLLCEFSIKDILRYPVGSGVPERQWGKLRVSPEFILSNIYRIQDVFGIPIILTDNAGIANTIAIHLLKAAHKIFSVE